MRFVLLKICINKRNYIGALLLHEEPHEQVVLIINTYKNLKKNRVFLAFYRGWGLFIVRISWKVSHY